MKNAKGTVRTLLWVVATIAIPAVAMAAQEEGGGVAGTWLGTLKVQTMELRIVFHFAKEEDGSFGATMDSPDQGAKGIAVDEVTVEGDVVGVTIRALGVVYTGTLSEDRESIDGTFEQGGGEFPLLLERVDEVPALDRPQEPKPPFPYKEEEVLYRNETDGNDIAGTLTLPKSGGPLPAVLLITGSGPQDRDESIMGHRPFAVLADYLTRRGIAVLRVDDRGVGDSTGSMLIATSEDFATDVLAGVKFLRAHDKIDRAKIGLIGHSEGGLIAPMVAADSPDVAFIVLMAGTGINGEEILRLQSRLIAQAAGATEAVLDVNAAVANVMYGIVKEGLKRKAAREAFESRLEGVKDNLPENQKGIFNFVLQQKDTLHTQLQAILNPWFRFFFTFEPSGVLKRVQCPVLAINGELDLQVPPKENLQAIEEALRSGGNTDYTIKEFSGLNHLFQTAETGAPTEYAKIAETIAPAALEAIGDWILARVGE